MNKAFVTIPAVFCRQFLRTAASQGRAAPSSPLFPRTMSISSFSSSSTSSPGETNPAKDADLKVQHDAEQWKFFIPLAEDKDTEAVLQYAPTANGSVDLWHTGVPAAFRGKGVAKLLAQAALDHFSSRKTPMILTCTYIQRHAQLYPQPEHQKYIVTE